MSLSCLEKQKQVKEDFASCKTEEEVYQKIISLGRKQVPLEPFHKKPENIVRGCQSILYLRTWEEGGHLFFQSESDALISSGLAELLIAVYSGEDPETILKCPPTFIEDLGLSNSLTPNRANGLYSIHLRMKQEALKALVERSKKNG